MEKLIAHLRGAVEQSGTSTWLDTLLHADPHQLVGQLFSARGRLGGWHQVADELGGGLRDLGEAWAEGRILVLEEHAASERLRRALAQVAATLPVPPDAPLCLLAGAAEDDHALGLALAELCLRDAGWSGLWAGPRSPLDELIAAVRNGELQMVALSSSEATRSSRAVRTQAEKLGAVCRSQRIPLVLGGRGWWPEPLPGAVRVRDFAAFHEVLVKGRSR